MKLSNKRILEDVQRLGEISQKQLPVKVSYAIAKNISKIESELKIYNAEREKLIEQYSEKDIDGKIKADEKGQVIFEKEKIAEWDKDIKELLEIENEVEIHIFNIMLLDGYSMTPSELMLIDYMIEE